ncbi:MAG TPA: class I SAM-dependent methyltransferase [Spirochaetota bacterium]|nr:class I SAM-dependent methyltransferase [Spirochaetota bacterium]HPC39604.1 class I SAM-dependent methyltransferase [Spirochaetota bacterium]HPL17730.1 class I SAM-dependent methyltransferase [Spirochaetota bacterium]HQF09499.1 class I SAM-dependent methyltransferase [Spirochaetota bacterium]HQH98182.1 class I SAM-dependent methyltransferase [Spirochaetota bacterium]
MKVQEKYFDQATQATIKEKIKPLLDSVTNEKEKRLISEFWEKASAYFGQLFGIDRAIDQGLIGEDPASDIVIEETDAILEEGKKLEESIDNPELIKKIKKLFRECGIPVGIKSEIVKHAFTKPSGYAGDYGIIEMVYNEKIISRGFGYCADKRFLRDDYARAVRSRKSKMREILTDYLHSITSPGVEVLNIACGSSRELQEMFDIATFDSSKKIKITLVDHDQEALDFSRNVLKNVPSNVEISFLKHSVYDYVKNPDPYRTILAGKDIVYTIGLADYIPDQPLKSLIAFFYSLLNHGGKLIIAHKDSKNYSPLAPDWWCDWTFHLRNEAEVIDIVKSSGIDNFKLSIVRETTTNIIFFIMIEKE